MAVRTIERRMYSVKPLPHMPTRIPLRFDPRTKGGMARIIDAIHFDAHPPLDFARMERFVRTYIGAGEIDMERICTEDPSLLCFMTVREGDRLNDLDSKLLIMLGRIGIWDVVLRGKK